MDSQEPRIDYPNSKKIQHPHLERITMQLSGWKGHALSVLRCHLSKEEATRLTFPICEMPSVLHVTNETASLTFAGYPRVEMDYGLNLIDLFWPDQKNTKSTYIVIVIFIVRLSELGIPRVKLLARTDVLFRSKYIHMICRCVKL